MNATMIDWVVFLLIHVFVPMVGIVLYLRLVRRMKSENVPNSPTIQLFFVFETYGVLVMLILTALFWKWSGMASIGFFGLIVFGPIIMGYTAYDNFRKQNLSYYHRYTYWASVSFFVILVLLLVLGTIVSTLY